MFSKVIDFVKRLLSGNIKYDSITIAPYKVEPPVEIKTEETTQSKLDTVDSNTQGWQNWTTSPDTSAIDGKKSADIVEFPKKPRATKRPKNEVAANDPAPKNARKPRNTTTNKNTPPKVVPVKAEAAPRPTKPKKK
jgi:hypothetical protein